MQEAQFSAKKFPRPGGVSYGHCLLVCKTEAAALLSISPRALDYLRANKRIAVRRIGSRVLIPLAKRFARTSGLLSGLLHNSGTLRHPLRFDGVNRTLSDHLTGLVSGELKRSDIRSDQV